MPSFKAIYQALLEIKDDAPVVRALRRANPEAETPAMQEVLRAYTDEQLAASGGKHSAYDMAVRLINSRLGGEYETHSNNRGD